MEDVFVPSTWRRLFAMIIDQCFIVLFYIPFAGTFMRLFFTEEDVYISLGKMLVLFLVPALYEFVFLMILQATPGKWLLGLQVVPANNAHAELNTFQCILRPLASRLTFFFGWAIYALAFFRYDRTHGVDWIAETRVVQFKPRSARTKIRWVVGLLFILLYTYEGLSSASAIIRHIDWPNKQIELRGVFENSELPHVDVDGGFDPDDEEGE